MKIISGLFCVFMSFSAFAASDCSDILDASNAQSTWVSANNQGELVYRLTDRGDRIMDFSYAGYEGGGVALPKVPTSVTVQPSGQDDTSAIQAAIDKVSAMSLQNGFRGAVLLAPGTYSTSQALTITTSGVVLRGSGSNDEGTLVNLTGSPHVFLQIGNTVKKPQIAGKTVNITDSYVPSGAMQIHVENTDEFKVGDTVMLRRPVTEAWVEFMGMSNMCPRCDWLSPGKYSEYDRVVAAVDSSQKLITLDAPIPDSLDSQYTQANLVKYRMPDRIQHVGVENLKIKAPETAFAEFTNGPMYEALKISGLQNGWAQNIVGENFVLGVSVLDFSKWITLQDIAFVHNPESSARGAKQAQYMINNSQLIFFNRCTAGGNNTFSFLTGGLTQGPNVILNSIGNDFSRLEPHMRWSTGLLVDNFKTPQGGIDFMSRGTYGSGHGWAMGWGVIWNSTAGSLTLQQAPGTMTWVIGDNGNIVAPPFPAGGPGDRHMPNQYPATIESFGSPVSPKSLYLAQLCVRKGRAAVSNLGY